MKTLLSTKDCIRRLAIPEHRLVYAYRTGKLPEPTFLVAGRRVYTEEDVRRVANYFGVDLDGLETEGESNVARNIASER